MKRHLRVAFLFCPPLFHLTVPPDRRRWGIEFSDNPAAPDGELVLAVNMHGFGQTQGFRRKINMATPVVGVLFSEMTAGVHRRRGASRQPDRLYGPDWAPRSVSHSVNIVAWAEA
ncbi:hypothetical protein GCM10007387_50280 [Pseudoduganella albidiflava]|uniref:Uncharacterized protein n=1 Tax=Pseudoduganella albidiflava TaxID=321983 RepID=A0AA87Y146_9BURK|nr:hypothetical protein GCM10007387_50280 [Pseudoduganella albidiflava]